MPEFSLPHDHGAHGHTEDLYRELKNVEHFGAVCDIFKQLSDPTRVRIFWLLSHREECVINIAALLDMSSPAVSHHLRSLAQSGLIESRRCGKEVYYKAGDTMQIKLLHEIVEQVMQIACPEKAVDYQDSQEQIIRHVHNELTANLAERVTIEELSRKYLMNTTTLKRCFKQVYGETIAAHMKKHRMEQAASLLLKTQNDIAAIAQAVGYESQSRFTAAFKETYGELPTEYRREAVIKIRTGPQDTPAGRLTYFCVFYTYCWVSTSTTPLVVMRSLGDDGQGHKAERHERVDAPADAEREGRVLGCLKLVVDLGQRTVGHDARDLQHDRTLYRSVFDHDDAAVVLDDVIRGERHIGGVRADDDDVVRVMRNAGRDRAGFQAVA